MNSVHFGTPTTVARGPRGQTVRHTHYLRSALDQPVRSLITRYHHDLAGRVTQQWDARLTVAAQTDVHSLSGASLSSHHVDAGRHVQLIGLVGEGLLTWDGRGTRLRNEYDSQRRLIAVYERAEGGNEQATERLFRADSSSEAAARNACGRIIEHLDPAGQLTIGDYNLNGQALIETRRFINTANSPDWSHEEADNELQLEPERLATHRAYGSTGNLLSQLDARQHLQTFSYNIAGQLDGIALKPAGRPEAVLYQSLLYNADNQLERQVCGNGVVDTATYDPADGRVVEVKTQTDTGTTLRHARYRYDPMGNVLNIVDPAFTIRYFANRRVTADQAFTYDSLYRLTGATGCEAQVDPGHPGLPELSPIDDSLLLNYSQAMAYNDSGGLLSLIHRSDHAGQSRTLEMVIDPQSNRALSRDGSEPDFAGSFDACGNQRLLQRGGQPLLYNLRNQLERCTTVARPLPAASDHERFIYAANGKRLRTTRTTLANQNVLIDQCRYLPGLELHDNTDRNLEVIVIEGAPDPVRCLHWASGNPGIEDYQVRYSHGDHLGSCTLETDGRGLLISRERFHPFGTTASWASRSIVEADYKSIRYCARPMDASGLYYYGLRYYAPWLRHWIGPDPLGNVDGLNRYAMVGNNPVSFIDVQGTTKQPPPSTAAQSAQSTQTAIQILPASAPAASPVSQAESAAAPTQLADPRNNPPPLPKLTRTWQAWARQLALDAVNSRVGLALLPVGTSSPANAAIVSTLITAAAQLTIHATLFNPGWSPPGSWDPSGGGSLPPVDVTQGANRMFSMTTAAISTTGAITGAILGPIVGGYVDELRDTKGKAERKALAGKWIDTVDRLIAEQRLLEEVPERVQGSLRDQVLEIEALIGITWQTMNMLEKISLLRPGKPAPHEAVSRRGSVTSMSSLGDGVFYRKGPSRTPVPRKIPAV